VLRPEAGSSLEVEFEYGNGTELPLLPVSEDGVEVAPGLLVAPVPINEELRDGNGVNVSPGNRLEVVLLIGG
jgi:hypothetical protein